MKPSIAVDIDDVLADSTDALRQYVNEQAGVVLTPEQYRMEAEYWGYYEAVWKTHGLNGKVAYKDYYATLLVDQSHVPTLRGAVDAVQRLAQQYHLIFLTSRETELEQPTRTWLNSQFTHDDIELHFCRSHREDNAKTKGEICRDLSASILIDDNVGHCQSAVDVGVDAVLFGDYGWQFNAPDTIRRCKDWPAVLEYFDGR